MTTDILFKQDETGNYDLELDDDGDFVFGDFFDTSILYSIFGERRALTSEVPVSSRRRGWIGNEFSTYENGSKIWLYEQSKLTRTVMNNIEREAVISLTWLVDDNFATKVSAQVVLTDNDGVGLNITIERPNSEVDERFFELWNNTGISNA